MSRIFNLGSLNVDHVYRVPEIVAPGSTLAAMRHDIHSGGKGLNQSIASALAGATVHHIGRVGPDGQFLVDELEHAGVDTSAVLRTDRPSGHALIQVDPQGQNAIVISGGANHQLDRPQIQTALDALDDTDWLLLQNEVNDMEFVLAEAAKRGIRVAFNVAPIDHRVAHYDLSAVALLVVNQQEAAALTGGLAAPAALQKLCDENPDATIVVTLGRNGTLLGASGRIDRQPAFEVEAVDETAAGDSFMGHLLASQINGEDIDESMRRARAAGALAVTKNGASPSVPTAADVDRFLKDL